MKIAVAGTGYVGLSLAILLAQKYEVVAFDVDSSKVERINSRISPIEDHEITEFFNSRKLNLTATLDKKSAYLDSKFVIIATPTNFDVESNSFDTSSILSVIDDVNTINPTAVIVIKSTIPIGFMGKIKHKFPSLKIMFSPEFLREGRALFDNLYPSRIVIGDKSAEAIEFAKLLTKCAVKKNIAVLFTNDEEAESVKLFANTYLAMRVAFFNELDNYCIQNDLNSMEIIKGVSLDDRIGDYYNNPSFGYGGYCLPKDTKQLLVNYSGIPESLISAIVKSNDIRKKFIVKRILALNPQVVGIYRLVMKHGSDNFRDAAILDIMKMLQDNGISIIVYEPNISIEQECFFKLISDVELFKQQSEIILTNRLHVELEDVQNKIFTRDIFTRD